MTVLMTTPLTSDARSFAEFAVPSAATKPEARPEVPTVGHLCEDNCVYCWGPETD